MNQNNIFSGIKVIELASVLAGPSVGQFFAELGAEVIKVENPNTNGDVTRSWKLKSEDKNNNVSAYFAAANWGKTHIFKDLNDESDRNEVYNLIKDSDIVISSYKPGDAKKLGFDYQTLKQIKGTIICGNITGYGNHDPRSGYDAIIQAEAGFMYMNGEKDSKPTKMPVAMMDILTAHQLKEGILVALYQREKTAVGSEIQVSLFDTGVSSLVNQATNYLVANHIPQRIGSGHPNIVPYGTLFTTKDGKEIVLAVGNDKQFSVLCSILEISEIAADEKFKTNFSRVQNGEALNQILSSSIKILNRKPLLKTLQENKVPAGAVNDIRDVFELKAAQKMILNYNDSDLKGIKNVAFEMK